MVITLKGKTHVAFGMVASTYVISNFTNFDLEPLNYVPIVAFATVGSLLPDIDHQNSKLGSKIPIIPKLLKHRGITHTVYFVALSTFLISSLVYSFNLEKVYILSFLIGICTHLIGDILTPSGLSVFALGKMFNRNFRIPIVRDEKVESIIQYSLLMLLPFTII